MWFECHDVGGVDVSGLEETFSFLEHSHMMGSDDDVWLVLDLSLWREETFQLFCT